MPGHYKYASELIEDIKRQGDFCIGAACYPEGHVESEHKTEDIAKLKANVDSGVDFLTTQMFFDNSVFYNFLYRIREKGITVPVLPGIMPVTNGKQIARSCQLSGAVLPSRFRAIVDKFGDNPKAMQQAGIAYATDQIIDLIANGIQNIPFAAFHGEFTYENMISVTRIRIVSCGIGIEPMVRLVVMFINYLQRTVQRSHVRNLVFIRYNLDVRIGFFDRIVKKRITLIVIWSIILIADFKPWHLVWLGMSSSSSNRPPFRCN
jgi:hypothetical protein